MGDPLGMARIVSFPMVLIEHRPAVPVMEPREYRGRPFNIRRQAELAQCGLSDDCEGCRVAQSEAKPQSEGCRDRIREAMMSDDVGQQGLQLAWQRLAPGGRGWPASAELFCPRIGLAVQLCDRLGHG